MPHVRVLRTRTACRRQLGAAVDITARKQAEEERETPSASCAGAEAAGHGRLGGSIAHDANNILLGVRATPTRA
jgi:hypothetical protein